MKKTFVQPKPQRLPKPPVVSYTDAQIEAVLRIMAFIAAIRNDMLSVKYTPMYTPLLDKAFDQYHKAKLDTVFKENDPGYISDLVVAMNSMFEKLMKVTYDLALQPEAVQERFKREMDNLLISCGIQP